MMKNRTKLIGMLVVGVLALGQAGQIHAADANPPELMTYQGYLVDGNGNPLGNSAPANYDVIFRIYNVKQGGASVWTEQQTVTVDKGYFSVLLGEGVSFGNEPRPNNLSTIFVGSDVSDRFVGITVNIDGTSVEIAPRLRFVASPYAFTATQARSLTDDSGNSNFFKDSATSSLKLGAGSIPTLTLPEAGGATLEGKLTADLSGWGFGIQIDNGNDTTTLGGSDVNSFNLSTSLAGFTFNKPIETSGIIFSGEAGLTTSTGDYGSVMTTGVGRNGNDGYSIGGRYNFMANGDNYVGTYNDLDNKWLWLYDRSLDRHIWHSDGGHGRLTLSPTGLYVTENLNVGGSATVSGNVGIGTTTPYFKMQINYDGNAVPWYDSNGWHDGINFGLTIKNNLVDTASPANGQTHNLILFTDKNSTQAAIGGYREAYYAHFLGGLSFHTASQPSGYIGNTPTNPQQARVSLTEKMRITPQGYVGIGTTSPSTYLHVGIARDAEANSSGLGSFMIGSRSGLHLRMDDNEIMAVNNNSTSTLNLNYNGGTVRAGHSTVTSDQRLKHNIHPIKYGLSELRKLKPVSYDWKLDLFNLPGTQLGFIAQDVQKVLPELVMVEENSEESRFKDELALNVNGILPVVVASVQALDEENRQLKSDLETLKSEMAVLKARLANSTTQEDRIARLEEMVSKIGQGQ